MSFSDPQTLTVNSVAQTLNRVKSDGSRSEYLEDVEEFKMTISHQESKTRTRRMVRVDQRVIAEDPLTAVSEYKTLGVYIVVDEPEYGFADTDIGYLVTGLIDWLEAGTNVADLLANQH